MGPRGTGAHALDHLSAAAPRLAVVTLAWRNEPYAAAFAASLATAAARCPAAAVELVVVVNGPDGETAAAALAGAARFRTTVVSLPDNTGFAGGANAGVAEAVLGGPDVIVVANLDVTFDGQFVARLVETLGDGWDLLVPQVLEPTGANGAARRRSFHRHAWLRPQPGRRQPVEAGNGSCLILRPAVAAQRTAEVGGLFDHEYRSFNEDVDLFWWANRRGLAIAFTPDVVVTHAHAGSYGRRHRFADRTADVQRQAMANYRVTVWKHASSAVDWLGWLLGEAVYLGQVVVAAGLAGAVRYGQSWWDSLRVARAISRRRGSLRLPASPSRPGRWQPAARP